MKDTFNSDGIGPLDEEESVRQNGTHERVHDATETVSESMSEGTVDTNDENSGAKTMCRRGEL